MVQERCLNWGTPDKIVTQSDLTPFTTYAAVYHREKKLSFSESSHQYHSHITYIKVKHAECVESFFKVQNDGLMDDLRFYVLFNSISVISGRCLDDNERLCAMKLRLRLRRFHLE